MKIKKSKALKEEWKRQEKYHKLANATEINNPRYSFFEAPPDKLYVIDRKFYTWTYDAESALGDLEWAIDADPPGIYNYFAEHPNPECMEIPPEEIFVAVNAFNKIAKKYGAYDVRYTLEYPLRKYAKLRNADGKRNCEYEFRFESGREPVFYFFLEYHNVNGGIANGEVILASVDKSGHVSEELLEKELLSAIEKSKIKGRVPNID